MDICKCAYVYRYFWSDRDTTPKAIGAAVGCREIRKPHPFRGLDVDVRPLSFYETSDKRPLARISVSFVNLSNQRSRATHTHTYMYTHSLSLSLFEYLLLYFFSSHHFPSNQKLYNIEESILFYLNQRQIIVNVTTAIVYHHRDVSII